MTDTIGRRIAQQRRMEGLSQEALGDKLGVSRQAISKWESDVCIPEVEKLIAMSKIFNISVDELLGVENPKPSDENSSEDSQAMVEQFLNAFQMTSPPPPPQPEPVMPTPAAEPEQATSRIQWLPLACIVLGILMSVISLSHINQPAENTGADAALLTRLETMEQELAALQEKDKQSDDTIERLMSIVNSAANDVIDLERDVEALTVGLGTAPTLPTDSLPEYESLLSWSLTGEAASDLSTVNINFRCASTAVTQAAKLSVLQQGTEVASVDCSGDANGYAANFTLPAKDGYQYILRLTHRDGTAERINLEGHGLGDLAVLTAPQIRLASGDLTVDSQKQMRFWISYNKIILTVPRLVCAETPVEWSDLKICCYQNDLPVDEVLIAELNSGLDEVDTTQRTIGFRVPSWTCETDPFVDGDHIRLTLEGTLTIDGHKTELAFLLGDWSIQNNKFISNTN